MSASFSIGSLALASGLRGFPSSILRVRVERVEGRTAWVRTADLLDAGTPLVLDISQVESEPEDAAPSRARGGLVAFDFARQS